MMPWGFLRFEMNTHKPFSICGYSFQNASGIPKGRQFLWLWVSNRGESTLLAGESKGDRLEQMVHQMKMAEGVTEELKAADPMAWVGAMNNIRNRAEESILRELIYGEDMV